MSSPKTPILAKRVVTLYAVQPVGGDPIELLGSATDAENAVATLTKRAAALGIVPDYEIVVVTETVTYSKPRPYEAGTDASATVDEDAES